MNRLLVLHGIRRAFSINSSRIPPIDRCRQFCSKPSVPVNTPMQFVQPKTTSKHRIDTVIDEIDWDTEMQEIYREEGKRSLLDPVENENDIDCEPTVGNSFNLAAYAPQSPTLQELLRLGVSLYAIERRKGLAKFLLTLDFERDMKDHIYYLTNELGLNADAMGWYLTKNPLIFKESIDDLRTRVNYLESKNFTQSEIVEIVERNPFWLMFSTKRIDERLGFFQREFKMTGNEVRSLVVHLPKLITSHLQRIKEITFSIREELELENDDVKKLLLKCPKIWIKSRLELMEKYDLITRKMKVPQEVLLESPHILLARTFVIQERHGFLKSLGRAQYDCKLDLYVSLDVMYKGTNDEFAVNVAKSTPEEFDKFLRTL